VSHTPGEILKHYWGYNAFRPLQEDIVMSVLDGHDTLALLPTGGGKSICFQVPALCLDGLCLVISPLIALMKDQVENLARRDIPALCLFTGMPYREIVAKLKTAAVGNTKFLYCSPERIQSSLFQEYLPALPLSMIAVDEAHCISQWGYDFRPSYLEIAKLRSYKPRVPILALTASAPTEVRDDIMARLKFRSPRMFSGSFARANLSYHVIPAGSKIHTLTRIMKRSSGSGIVYCRSRKRTKEIADLLRLENIEADHYHAGLPHDIRNQRQEDWIRGKTRVIVCTNAFGMGIDKPDVRVVVHLDCPDSLEHYYQEAGRAGRDGQLAHAILLTDANTVPDLEKLPDSRYPPMQVIRKVYQALGDYLQLAAGTGEGRYFDFELGEFTKRFGLELFEAMYAIQALEQENILSLSEQIFLPSKLVFTTDRETLEFAESRHPALEPLIKSLLRTYSGIWDQPTGISEKQLAGILHLPEEQVRQGLAELQARGLVEYEPRKEKPQILYLQNRVRTEDLYVDHARYLARKQAFTRRLDAMKKYVENGDECRTRLLCRYFGDEVQDCGICDHCTRRKRSGVEPGDLLAVLKNLLAAGPIAAAELMEQLPGDGKDAEKLIDYLIAEGKLDLTNEGKLMMRKGL